MVISEVVLFSGELGTQRVRVWLEWHGNELAMLSHDVGPALEDWFGKDDIETFLTVRAEQLTLLAQALGCGSSPDEVMRALAERYDGDSAATTHFQGLLDERSIPYDYSLA